MKKNRLIILISLILIIIIGSFILILADQKHGAVKSKESILDVKIDFNQDLTKLSLQDLRLLKNTIYAKQGYCFMEADLRSYFSAKYKDYDSIMTTKFFTYDFNGKKLPIDFSIQEKEFIKKIDVQVAKRLKKNYIRVENRLLANADNIINLYQLGYYSPEFLEKLRKNNFVIIPEKDIQLFHVYEKNDYQQFPNFITTDLFLQAFHTYFAWVIKSVEKKEFSNSVQSLSEKMYDECIKLTKNTDTETKSAAEFDATWFAIACKLICDKTMSVPSSFTDLYEKEIDNIERENDHVSEFLGITDRYYLYSLYKPRGHYARSPESKSYFKSMMWLQTASMCMTKDRDLKRAVLMAFILNKDGNRSLLQLYKSIYDPLVFLFGEADNISVLDLVTILKTLNISELSQIYNTVNIEKIRNSLLFVYRQKNRITPKVIIGCEEKIDFMPQRYLPDNEVLSNMYDSSLNAERAYPQGLDVMAAFGNGFAERLLRDGKEDLKWTGFSPTLAKMKSKFSSYSHWNDAVYNKWIESLMTLQKINTNYPVFMQTEQWNKKNLNTSLSSWAELKHDACLYAEQPTAAECGDGGPPPPILVSYVEPNVDFWKKTVELINLTIEILKKNNLYSASLKTGSENILKQASFLLKISQKEINKIRVTDEEFDNMKIIGADFEYLSLSILEPDTNYTSWENVKGPDKSVAVVADIFTRNIPDDNKNGILHVATGNVNHIYVVVEINGYLYITKGAVLNYYEFIEAKARLNDEEWQNRLEKNKAPANPKWMEEIFLKDNEIIKQDEKLFYGSGC